MAAHQQFEKVEKIGKVDFLARLNSQRASELKDISAFNFYGYGSVEAMREGMARMLSGDRISTLIGSDYVKSRSFLDAARRVGLDERLIAKLSSDYQGVQAPFTQEELLQIGQTVLADMAGVDGKLNWQIEGISFIKDHDLSTYGHDLITLKHALDHDPNDFTATIGKLEETDYSHILDSIPNEPGTRPDAFNPQSVSQVGGGAAYTGQSSYMNSLSSYKAGGASGGYGVSGVSGVSGVHGGYGAQGMRAEGAGGAGVASGAGALGAGPVGPVGPRTGVGAGGFNDSQLYSAPRPQKVGDPKLQQVINQPGQGLWITNFSSNPYEEIDKLRGNIADANSKGQVPVVISYFIKGRDQAVNSAGGTHSAGGARSDAEWRSYYRALSEQIGNGTAIVVMEPDALGHSVNDNNFTKAALIREAVMYLRQHNPNIKISLDMANSAWMANRIGQAADMLKAAGMEYADYFTSNIAQFEALGNEIGYINKIVAALEARGIEGKKGIIDTGRNGLGPGDGATYNAKGVSLGHKPTFNTHSENVAAYLWLKTPGQWDGGEGIRAGQFVQSYLEMLYRNAVNNPNSDYMKS